MFLWHITDDTYCHSFRAVKTTCPDWTDCALVGSPGGGFWKQAGQVLRTCFGRTARKRWRAQCDLPVEVGCRVLTLPGVKRPHRNTAIRTAKEAADGASRWIKWGNLRLNVRTWSIPGWVANPNHPRNLGKITDDARQHNYRLHLSSTYAQQCIDQNVQLANILTKTTETSWCMLKIKVCHIRLQKPEDLECLDKCSWKFIEIFLRIIYLFFFLKIRKLWYRLSNCKVSSYPCSSAGRSW